jgi:hypothetical protein
MEMLPAPRAARILLVPEVVKPETELVIGRPLIRPVADYRSPRPADPVGLFLDLYV